MTADVTIAGVVAAVIEMAFAVAAAVAAAMMSAVEIAVSAVAATAAVGVGAVETTELQSWNATAKIGGADNPSYSIAVVSE